LKSIKFSNVYVEIIISDNSSTDDTSEVVSPFLDQFKFIKYYKNSKNVKDLNFYLVVEKAKSKYVWVFSDDDIMMENAINEIYLKITKSNNYSLIICNYSLWDYNLEKCYKKQYLNIGLNTTYYDPNLLLEDFGIRLGFLSCLVFKRDDFLKFDRNTFNQYVKYGFPFMLNIYNMQFSSCNVFFIKQSLLKQRGNLVYGNIDWWYDVFTNGTTAVFYFLKKLGYKEKTINKAKKNLILNDILKDIFFRKVNNENVSKKLKILYKNYHNYPEFFLILFALCIPSFIYKIIYFIKNSN
jgi:hypothetical protein